MRNYQPIKNVGWTSFNMKNQSQNSLKHQNSFLIIIPCCIMKNKNRNCKKNSCNIKMIMGACRLNHIKLMAILLNWVKMCLIIKVDLIGPFEIMKVKVS